MQPQLPQQQEIDPMPMDFPDMKALERAAQIHKFRKPNRDETEAQYRTALADHVTLIDFIESQEIRTSKGWDQWDESEQKDMLRRSILSRTETSR
jgi:hypothetical protein